MKFIQSCSSLQLLIIYRKDLTNLPTTTELLVQVISGSIDASFLFPISITTDWSHQKFWRTVDSFKSGVFWIKESKKKSEKSWKEFFPRTFRNGCWRCKNGWRRGASLLTGVPGFFIKSHTGELDTPERVATINRDMASCENVVEKSFNEISYFGTLTSRLGGCQNGQF